jgi:nicotinate-nucleotide pyrophosphorylase (carboxylating)
VSDAVFSDIRVTALIELALHEDLGEGDRTSESTVPAAARARGRLLAKEALVVCGLPILPRVQGLATSPSRRTRRTAATASGGGHGARASGGSGARSSAASGSSTSCSTSPASRR